MQRLPSTGQVVCAFVESAELVAELGQDPRARTEPAVGLRTRQQLRDHLARQPCRQKGTNLPDSFLGGGVVVAVAIGSSRRLEQPTRSC